MLISKNYAGMFIALKGISGSFLFFVLLLRGFECPFNHSLDIVNSPEAFLLPVVLHQAVKFRLVGVQQFRKDSAV